MVEIIVPNGPGVWVAYPNIIGGYDKIAEQLIELGIGVVYPRAGDAGNADGAWTQAACSALVRAGIQVYPWRYSRAGIEHWRAELDGYKRDLDWGASGIVVDAEIHWKATDNKDAHAFVDALFDLNCFVADAPWPWIGIHSYPDAFGRLHARMPQVYWTEINNQGAAYVWNETQRHWNEWNKKQQNLGHESLIKPIYPIGVTYGNQELQKLRAGKCPGEFHLNDLKYFIEANASTIWSLYSLEAAALDALNYIRSLKPHVSEIRTDTFGSPPLTITTHDEEGAEPDEQPNT